MLSKATPAVTSQICPKNTPKRQQMQSDYGDSLEPRISVRLHETLQTSKAARPCAPSVASDPPGHGRTAEMRIPCPAAHTASFTREGGSSLDLVAWNSCWFKPARPGARADFGSAGRSLTF